MPAYYPLELIGFIGKLLGVWLFVNILSLFLPGWKSSFASINTWKNQFRKIIFQVVLVLMRIEIEEKNGRMKHTKEKEWGVHFLAAILLPSAIAFMATSFIYSMAQIVFQENILWGILVFSITFVSIFAIIPSSEEMISLLKTSKSSGWNWFFNVSGRETSGKDLTLFFKKWFYSWVLPEVKISHFLQEGEEGYILKLKITQLKDTFVFPLQIEWRENGEKVRKKILIDEKNEEFEFQLSARPHKIKINPDKAVPGKFR